MTTDANQSMAMLVYSGFVFSLNDRTGYNELKRRSESGWVTIPILNGPAVSQHMQTKPQTVKLSGQWAYADGVNSLTELRALQRLGTPGALSDGHGNNLGLWKLLLVEENHSNIMHDNTSLTQRFTIELEQYFERST